MDTQEDFEMWVTDMPDMLEEFRQLVAPQALAKLDGTPESLRHLEGWLLERYATVEDVMQDPVVERLDGAARYVGEVFRTNLGGTWQISFESEKDINYGMPVIDGFPGQETPLSPHRLVTTSVDRRTGKFLSTVFANQKALGRGKQA